MENTTIQHNVKTDLPYQEEESLVFLKPHVMLQDEQNGLTGMNSNTQKMINEIGTTTVDGHPLKIVAHKLIWVTEEQLQKHYANIYDKPFFPEVREMMTEGPIMALIVSGNNAIQAMVEIAGPTYTDVAIEEAPTSLRARNGVPGDKGRNSFHRSANKVDAQNELTNFFPKRAEAGQQN